MMTLGLLKKVNYFSLMVFGKVSRFKRSKTEKM